MRTGTSLTLITVGAILRFAVKAASPLGLNVHIIGVILILVGILGMTMPRLARSPRVTHPLRVTRSLRVTRAVRVPRVPRDRLRRWVRPGQSLAFGEPFGANAPVPDDRPAPAEESSVPEDPPTLLDNILSFEHRLL